MSSVHGRLRDLRAFTRWLEDEALIDRAPNLWLAKLPQDEFPVAPDTELQCLFSREHLTFPGNLEKRNRAVIALLVVMGLRRFEVTSLTLDEYQATWALRSESQQLGGALEVPLLSERGGFPPAPQSRCRRDVDAARWPA